MEKQSPTIIRMNREQLLLIVAAVILAGMASNYSTVCPSTTHASIARRLAQDLLDSSLKGNK